MSAVPARIEDSAGSTERVTVLACLAALVSALMFVKSPFDGNGDTAWLISVAEHMLDGKRLYEDLLEVNPPMSALIYLGPVWIARTLEVAPEVMVHGMLVTLATPLLFAGWRLAPECGLPDRSQRIIIVAGIAFAVLLLPSRCFAQREHVALIGLALYALVTVATSARPVSSPGRAWSLAGGAYGGLAICIKPHFIVVLGLMHAWLVLVAWREQRLSLSLPAVWKAAGFGLHGPIAGLALAVYLASIGLLFQAFFTDMYPLVRDAYLPFRLTSTELVSVPAGSIGLASIGLMLWLLGRDASPLSGALAAGAVGGVLVFALQGKGWGYHQLPTFGFVAMAVAAHLADQRAARSLSPHRLSPLLGLAVILGVLAPMELNRHEEPRRLEAAIRATGPDQTILIASSNLGLQFPLVRRLDGEWVGRVPSLWITNGAGQLLVSTTSPAHGRRLRELLKRDLDMFVTDAVTRRPSLLGFAIEGGASARDWAVSDPRMAALLLGYEPMGTHDGVALYRRRSGL